MRTLVFGKEIDFEDASLSRLEFFSDVLKMGFGLGRLGSICQMSNVQRRMSNEFVKRPSDQLTQLGKLVSASFDK